MGKLSWPRMSTFRTKWRAGLTCFPSNPRTRDAGSASRSILVVVHHKGIARRTATQYDAIIRLLVQADSNASFDGSEAAGVLVSDILKDVRSQAHEMDTVLR